MDKHTDRIQSLLNEDLDAMVLDGKKAKHKRRLIAVASVAAISIIVFLLVNWFMMRNSKYNEAVTSLNNEEYELAAQLFDELGNYQDSAELLTKRVIISVLRRWKRAALKKQYITFKEPETIPITVEALLICWLFPVRCLSNVNFRLV